MEKVRKFVPSEEDHKVDFSVYWKILHDNPNSAAVLEQVAAAVDDLRNLAASGSQEQLGELLGSIRKMLGDNQATLFDRSNKMFQLDAEARMEGAEESPCSPPTNTN